MVILQEETLLCQVLEGVCDNESGPPSSWVESVRSVLEDVHWSGLLSQCEGRIMVQLPVLTSADILLASLVSSSSFGTKLTPKRSTGSIRSISTGILPGGYVSVGIYTSGVCLSGDTSLRGMCLWEYIPQGYVSVEIYTSGVCSGMCVSGNTSLRAVCL